MYAADVGTPHPGRQAVFRAVRDPQGILVVVEADDGCDRAKNLFLGNAHLVVNPGEYRGADEIA